MLCMCVYYIVNKHLNRPVARGLIKHWSANVADTVKIATE